MGNLDDIHGLLDATEASDVREALWAVGALRDSVADIEGELVVRARLGGARLSWDRIASLLARPKRTVFDQYRAVG